RSLVDLAGAKRSLNEAPVTGCCVYCASDWRGTLDIIRRRGMPVVTTESPAEAGPDALVVALDERAATRELGEHVARFGHRRIAVLADWVVPERQTGPVYVPDPETLPYYLSRERICGIRDALLAAGGSWSDLLVLHAADHPPPAPPAAPPPPPAPPPRSPPLPPPPHL